MTAIGVVVLGSMADDVGSNSNWEEFAMMMYLAGVPVFTIMKMGRWLSDTFLDYIEKQVLTFSHGISKKMIAANTFFNFPVKKKLRKKKDPKTMSIGHYKQPVKDKVFG